MKVKDLNDSKLVAMIIYISSIVVVNVGTGITVAGIFTLSTIILGLNFVPKVWCTMTIIIASTLKKFCTQLYNTIHNIHTFCDTHILSLSLTSSLYLSLLPHCSLPLSR